MTTCRDPSSEPNEHGRASAVDPKVEPDGGEKLGLSIGDLDGDGSDDTAVSSAATLTLPAGATIVKATLIVGQSNSSGTVFNYPTDPANYAVKFGVPGQPYASVQASAVDTPAGGGSTYRASYDVTSLVALGLDGLYWVADMQAAPSSARNIASSWNLLVIYELLGEPTRVITEYGALPGGCYQSSSDTTLEFTVPATGTPRSQLTVFGADGDPSYAGEAVRFGGTALSNGVNPSNNIGNSTVSDDSGAIVRLPASFRVSESVDIDTFDVSSLVSLGQTNAPLTMSCLADGVFWQGAVHSVNSIAPDVTVTKAVADLNGGVLEVGDILEYSVTVATAGAENAVNLVLSDTLVPELAYIPGSLAAISHRFSSDSQET